MRRFTGAAIALALWGAPFFAQDVFATEPDTGVFAQRSLKAGRIQASLALLASQRAQNPAVRRFAEALLHDMRARNERCARIVRDGGVRDVMDEVRPYASDEIPERTREFHRLRTKDGPAFDKQFLKAVVVGHENAIRGYEAEEHGANDKVRAVAAEALPRLKEQLGAARRLIADIEERR
jgi:putative membrane protein